MGLDFDKYRTGNKKAAPTGCDSCVYYDYDEDVDANVCQMDLDEDEQISFLSRQTARSPYYRYYDEYKSVQKQN